MWIAVIDQMDLLRILTVVIAYLKMLQRGLIEQKSTATDGVKCRLLST